MCTYYVCIYLLPCVYGVCTWVVCLVGYVVVCELYANTCTSAGITGVPPGPGHAMLGIQSRTEYARQAFCLPSYSPFGKVFWKVPTNVFPN